MNQKKQWGLVSGMALMVTGGLVGCGTAADVLRSDATGSSSEAQGEEALDFSTCDPDAFLNANVQDGHACTFGPGSCAKVSECEMEEFSCQAGSQSGPRCPEMVARTTT